MQLTGMSGPLERQVMNQDHVDAQRGRDAAAALGNRPTAADLEDGVRRDLSPEEGAEAGTLLIPMRE